MKYRVLLEISKEYAVKYGLPTEMVGKMIILYEDRFAHFERHKDDYSVKGRYTETMLRIDEIVAGPDFIAFDCKNYSYEFIKKLDNNVLVAVRMSQSKMLKVKTVYPISDVKYEKLRTLKLSKTDS